MKDFTESYMTQAGIFLATTAQKEFWDDKALDIADNFECVFDDMVDNMTILKAKVVCHNGSFYGTYPDYALDEDNSFLVAEIEIEYDFTKDGLIYTYQAYAEIDFNDDPLEDMNSLRKKAKLISVKPTSQVSTHILMPTNEPVQLTA